MLLLSIPNYANTIYDDNTMTSQITTIDNVTISVWDGVSDNSLVGEPYVTYIKTDIIEFNVEGFSLSGEINVIVQYGNITITEYDNKIILSEIGERYVFLLENYVNITIHPKSSSLLYGAPLNLSTTDQFKSSSIISGFANLYSNIDFKGDDIHINNGTNNAINLAWNSTWYKSPWLIIKTNTPDGWVWWHQHPYGVTYIPLRGCVIYYCYTEMDKDCYKTTDGIVRYEHLGVIYREKIQIQQGYDECIFGVTDFYINEPMGQPIFYPNPHNLSSTVMRPLRSHFYT